MSSLQRGPNFRSLALIAASAFAGTLFGFTCAFVYFKFRRKSFDFGHLSDEIFAIRKELDDLKETVRSLKLAEVYDTTNVKTEQATDTEASKQVEQNEGRSIFSSMSQASLEAYFDASASFSDSSDNVEPSKRVVESDQNANTEFRSWLKRIVDMADSLQAKGSDEARTNAYQILQANYLKGKSSYEYLWRFAMASYLYSQTFLNRNQTKRRSLCLDAQRYAFEALALKEDDANVHKWCALTLGVMGEFVGMKQKIEDGRKFKTHIDRALSLKPDDAVLHHLRGRWCLGVACLSWFERQVATTLFATPPSATYDDALTCFLQADRLKPDWLENILYVTKVYLAQNDTKSVRHWIAKARAIKQVSADDRASMKELSAVLSKLSQFT